MTETTMVGMTTTVQKGMSALGGMLVINLFFTLQLEIVRTMEIFVNLGQATMDAVFALTLISMATTMVMSEAVIYTGVRILGTLNADILTQK